jgi:hypothetical protein
LERADLSTELDEEHVALSMAIADEEDDAVADNLNITSL